MVTNIMIIMIIFTNHHDNHHHGHLHHDHHDGGDDQNPIDQSSEMQILLSSPQKTSSRTGRGLRWNIEIGIFKDFFFQILTREESFVDIPVPENTLRVDQGFFEDQVVQIILFCFIHNIVCGLTADWYIYEGLDNFQMVCKNFINIFLHWKKKSQDNQFKGVYLMTSALPRTCLEFQQAKSG